MRIIMNNNKLEMFMNRYSTQFTSECPIISLSPLNALYLYRVHTYVVHAVQNIRLRELTSTTFKYILIFPDKYTREYTVMSVCGIYIPHVLVQYRGCPNESCGDSVFFFLRLCVTVYVIYLIVIQIVESWSLTIGCLL